MVLSDKYIINTLKTNIKNTETSDNYINRLQNLSLKLHKSIYDIIKNPDITDIQIIYPNINTQKNKIIVIMSVFKYIPELSSKKSKTLEGWSKIYEDVGSLKIDVKETPITKKDIENKYLEFKSNNPHEELSKSQEYLLLSIVLHSPSQIIDFVRCPTKGSITAPTKLADDLLESVKKHPRSYIFMTSDRKMFTSNNSYTVYVSRTFKKLFGINLGINTFKRLI
jgi:hypothetical protein